MNAQQALTPSDWRALNYQGLLAEVGQIKQRLQKRPSAPVSDTSVMLDRLCQVFGLSVFERQLLLLGLAAELDADVAPLYREAVQLPRPNLALSLSLFDGDCGAMAPDAPLRYFLLIELDAEDASLMRGGFCVSEWTLMYLLGEPILDPQMSANLRPLAVDGPILDSRRKVARAANWARQAAGEQPSAIQLVSDSADDARQVVALMAQATEQPVYELDLYQLPVRSEDQQGFLRRLERELIAQQSLLLIHGERLIEQSESTFDREQLRHWLDRLIRDLPAACVLASREPLPLSATLVRQQVIPAVTDAERLQLWQHHLGVQEDSELHRTVLALNHQYRFTGAQVRAIANAVHADPAEGAPSSQKLWHYSREQSRQDLEGLARVITPKALAWEDLVLPQKEKDTLVSLVSQAQSRHQVYQQWGFAEKREYGFGICALFAGASGTGKTFAARIIASALKLDLYHIELGSVVDKYIGETEKKLDRIFTAAEKSGAVLLFDEADALFGKRSRVQDAKDRYANMGVSFLLQRMEQFSGLSILTTNARSALDPAFTRRIRFIVNFPFPSETERANIWRRSIPANAPTEHVDYTKLARLTLAGGAISNITLQAAFMAAQTGQPITMALLREAVQQETIKAEKALDQTLVADW